MAAAGGGTLRPRYRLDIDKGVLSSNLEKRGLQRTGADGDRRCVRRVRARGGLW